MGLIQLGAVSVPGGAAANEDRFLASDSWVAVLDGITRYPDDGCVHDVPWYVARLGGEIARRIDAADVPLRVVLAEAIRATAASHEDTCDLENPVSPGATAALVRLAEERIEWLVLGDATVAWRDPADEVHVRSDERLAALPDPPAAVDVAGIRRYPVDYVARVRNRPGGFWVAAADPDAAAEAYCGAVDIGRLEDMLVCTDGLSRLVERYGHSWEEVFDAAERYGVRELAALVRDHERLDLRFGPGSKRHDDATGVFLRPHTWE